MLRGAFFQQANSEKPELRPGRLLRLFRRGEDGDYHEIEMEQARPGDRCAAIGLSGDCLFSAVSFVVCGRGVYRDSDGRLTLDCRTEKDLFSVPAEAN